MTLCDNPVWILSHVRNSFAVSDDTGNSQLVLSCGGGGSYASDQSAIAKTLRCEALPVAKTEADDDDDDDDRGTLEIRPGSRNVLMSYRPRCNTEIQLEKMRKERKNAPKVKVIHWKRGCEKQRDAESLFPSSSSPSSSSGNVVEKPPSSRRSLFSQLLSETPALPENPFAAFSRFGSIPGDEKRKEMAVVVAAAAAAAGNQQVKIRVSVNPTVTVRDVTGYVCWIYTRDGRLPKLKPDVDGYALFMAHADGEVEREMPPLEANEAISRYGFQTLGLAERDRRHYDVVGGGGGSAEVVLPDGSRKTIPFSSTSTVQDVTEAAVSTLGNSRLQQRYRYHMEAEGGGSSTALDPTAPMRQHLVRGGGRSFYLVREHSRRHSSSRAEPSVAVEFPDVNLLTKKLKLRTEATLVVTDDRIEVRPRSVRVIKAASYPVEDVVSCEVIVKKASSKVRLRLLVSSGGGGSKDVEKLRKVNLECRREAVAKEIEAKVNEVLDRHAGKARCEFLASKRSV